MLLRNLLGAVAAVAVTFSVGTSFAQDKDGCGAGGCCEGDKAAAKKDDKKQEVKQDGCCEGDKKHDAKQDEKAAAKKDGCCEGEKAAAKKDGCCKEGGEAAKKDCEGGSCGQAIEAKPASYTVKIDGMTCGGCSSKVTEAVKGFEGVSKIDVSSEKGTATFEIAGGKSIKLSALEKAIGDFKVDAAAPLKGIIRLTVNGTTCESCVKAVCQKVGGLKVEKVGCDLDAKNKTCAITFFACDKSEVTVKALRGLFAAGEKLSIAEIELLGAQKQAKTAPAGDAKSKT